MTAKSNSLVPKTSKESAKKGEPSLGEEAAPIDQAAIEKKAAAKKRAGKKRTAHRRADKVIAEMQPVLCGIGESKKSAICEELRKIVESL